MTNLNVCFAGLFLFLGRRGLSGRLSRLLRPDNLGELLVSLHAVFATALGDARGNLVPPLAAQAGRICLQRLLQQLLLLRGPRLHVQTLRLCRALHPRRRFGLHLVAGRKNSRPDKIVVIFSSIPYWRLTGPLTVSERYFEETDRFLVILRTY